MIGTVVDRVTRIACETVTHIACETVTRIACETVTHAACDTVTRIATTHTVTHTYSSAVVGTEPVGNLSTRASGMQTLRSNTNE